VAPVDAVTLRPTYRHPRERHYLRPRGPWDRPSLDEALSERSASVGRDRAAVVDPAAGLRLTRAELEARIAALAGGLREAGVRRGNVVAWQAPNGYRPLLLYRACWRLGAIAAPIHHQAGSEDARRMLDQVDPCLLLWPDDVVGARFDTLADGPPVTTSDAAPEDLAVVLFTSGSTGEPKAALHTQRGLAYKAETMVEAHGLTPDDATLTPAPLAHISGLLNAVLIGAMAPIVAVPMTRWDPEHALTLIAEERISFMIGPPTFFVSLMHAEGFASDTVETLRLVSCGGAGVTPAFAQEASERLGARVKRTYGSTEAPTVTTTTSADSEHDARETDGRAVGEVELRVDEGGELVLRGPELFVGYADAGQTDAVIDDGWFRTGDAARLDDGWLTIIGRLDDVIIRGGENISPGEIEDVLLTHPAVSDAAAIGVPSRQWGEAIGVVVVRAPGATASADELRDWVTQHLRSSRAPEHVEFRDELPYNDMGKLLRRVLRTELASLGDSAG
jgi:cyclohexanecarboxylate-CoA ligase